MPRPVQQQNNYDLSEKDIFSEMSFYLEVKRKISGWFLTTGVYVKFLCHTKPSFTIAALSSGPEQLSTTSCNIYGYFHYWSSHLLTNMLFFSPYPTLAEWAINPASFWITRDLYPCLCYLLKTTTGTIYCLSTIRQCTAAAVNMYITSVVGVFELCLERI